MEGDFLGGAGLGLEADLGLDLDLGAALDEGLEEAPPDFAAGFDFDGAGGRLAAAGFLAGFFGAEAAFFGLVAGLVACGLRERAEAERAVVLDAAFKET